MNQQSTGLHNRGRQNRGSSFSRAARWPEDYRFCMNSRLSAGIALLVGLAICLIGEQALAEGAQTKASDYMELPSNDMTDAVNSGDPGRVHVALLKGMSPNDTGTDGTPAVVRAAEKGFGDIVNYLVARGADPDRPDRKGRTALGLVAQSGRADIAQSLLSQQADANRVSSNGDTPLMIAARARRGEVVRVLLQYKADPDETDLTGRTALDLARESHFDDIVNIFRQFGFE